MSIRFRCPSCNRIIDAPEKAAGRSAKCPGCAHTVVVPSQPVPSQQTEEHRRPLQHGRSQASSSEGGQGPTEPPPLPGSSDDPNVTKHSGADPEMNKSDSAREERTAQSGAYKKAAHPSRRGRAKRAAGIILTLFVTGISLLIGYFGLAVYSRYQLCNQGEHVEGRIEKARVLDRSGPRGQPSLIEAHYVFTVAGKEYKGKCRTGQVPSRGRAQSDRVAVVYDPENPDRNTHYGYDVDPVELLSLIGSTALALVLGIVMVAAKTLGRRRTETLALFFVVLVVGASLGAAVGWAANQLGGQDGIFAGDEQEEEEKSALRKVEQELKSNPNSSSINNLLSREVSAGHVAAAKRLLEAGADANTQLHSAPSGLSNSSLLAAAAYHGNTEMVDVLLRFNAKFPEQYTASDCPILVAVTQGHLNVVKQLLAKRPNHYELHGRLLVEARKAGRKDILKVLLNGGIDPNHPRSAGMLHTAARKGDLETLRMLLDAHADPSAIVAGFTPLHKAVRGNQVEAARILLDAGADVNIKSPLLGRTPAELAEERGLTAIVQVLRQPGAQ